MAKQEVLRECCLTREAKPAAEMLRFALGPDDELVPDVDAKAPGRGVWVTASYQAVSEAMAKKCFSRSLKQAVVVPADLAQLTQRRLEERLLGAIGLARKAGQLMTGATRVRSAMEKPGIIALFTASDAAADGRQKMIGAARAHAEGAHVPHFELLSSGQLGLALGQENVIHAALIPGAAANGALARAEKLARYLADATS